MLFCILIELKKVLLFVLARWFPISRSKTSDPATPRQTSADQEVFNVRQFLLDYQKQKELAEGIGIEEDFTEDPGTGFIMSQRVRQLSASPHTVHLSRRPLSLQKPLLPPSVRTKKTSVVPM